jgi:hypothetical protein
MLFVFVKKVFRNEYFPQKTFHKITYPLRIRFFRFETNPYLDNLFTYRRYRTTEIMIH